MQLFSYQEVVMRAQILFNITEDKTELTVSPSTCEGPLEVPQHAKGQGSCRQVAEGI